VTSDREMPRLSSGRDPKPRKDLRFDPLQLDWVEAYAYTHDLTFSSVIQLAITRFIESELMKMDNLAKLFETLDWQTRKLEATILTERIKVASAGPGTATHGSHNESEDQDRSPASCQPPHANRPSANSSYATSKALNTSLAWSNWNATVLVQF